MSRRAPRSAGGIFLTDRASNPLANIFPLSSDSAHTPSVHRSWPIAEIRRIARRSSSEVAFENAKSHLCSKWRSGFLNTGSVHPFQSINFSAARGLKPKARAVETSRVIWLVLPYFPCWANNILRKRVCELVSKWHQDIAPILRSNWTIRISWKNQNRNLLDVLRSI